MSPSTLPRTSPLVALSLIVASGASAFDARDLAREASRERCSVEVDGVLFEFLIPRRTWAFPQKPPRKPDPRFDQGPTTPIKMGLRITNRTKAPLGFTLFDTIVVEMVGPDG